MIVARVDAADVDPVAVLEKNTAGVISIELGVVLAVSVEDEIFDLEVVSGLTAEQWEEGGGGGGMQLPEVFAQRFVEFEAVAALGDEGAFEDGLAAGLWVFGAQADAVTELEVGWILESDLLIVPIAVEFEWGGGGRFLDEESFGAFADEVDVGLEIDGVSESVGAGLDFDGPAAEAGEGVNSGLDDALVRADEICGVVSNGEGEMVLPCGLNGCVATGLAGKRDSGAFGGGERCEGGGEKQGDLRKSQES